VPLYIKVAKGPAVGCRPADTCCRWCLVVVETVVVVVVVGAVVEAAATNDLVSEVPALAGK
jgi:meiotically up-regulated gene 157 (Mug157) protein